MCDMQKMPQSRDDDICEEESDMNFATFQAVGTSGTHFVATTGGQIPVTKLQQNVGNGASLQQVVGMVGGEMQYLTHAAPQLISVPIALPGAKPGDPQPTVQIQVLNPNMLAPQQQPKYQMQIPIQGFPQGGAVLTVAYSPDANETGGIQLLGNTLPEGLQVVAAMPQEMQLLQPEIKEEQPIHQVYITPNQQIVINGPGTNGAPADGDDGVTNIVIKEEYDDNMNDEESSADKDTNWASTGVNADLIKYLHTLPPQQAQALPVSLQQFLRLNPPPAAASLADSENSTMDADNTESEMPDDSLLVVTNKKKKKYKKKPPKPARPKPGQVVIATAADGTTIYCCPECQMAYPEKEQLEMHLIVHKIERRFICGICGAGLKRKEHLERHKLGHNPERPYVCDVCMKGFKRREHLNLHAVIHSGVKTEMCGECGKGFYRKDHLRKHTRSHETKRARDEAAAGEERGVAMTPIARGPTVTPAVPSAGGATILPEITIHVPTSGNMQMPVQINIPQHVVSSLQAAANGDASSQLDALLAQHT